MPAKITSCNRTCLVCGKPFYAKASAIARAAAAYCSQACYWTDRRAHTPTVEERFWSRIDGGGGPDACWIWNGYRDKKNYGRFTFRADGRTQTVIATRFAWELANGPIPEGKFICHTCDNPPCVNPGHLWPGTQQENIDDMMEKGRHWDAAKLSDEDAARILLFSHEPIRALAIRFNVSESTIGRVRKNGTQRMPRKESRGL